MYGDTSYEIFHSGSTGASADTAHGLFGTFSGLTSLNDSDVIKLSVRAKTNSFLIYSTLVASSVEYGIGISTSTIRYQELPDLAVGKVSTLHFENDQAGSDATAEFVMWRRVN